MHATIEQLRNLTRATERALLRIGKAHNRLVTRVTFLFFWNVGITIYLIVK